MSLVETLSVTPSHVDIFMMRATDAEYKFTITDDDGDPYNITSDTVTLTVTDSDGATIFSKTNTVGGHLDPLDGTTVFNIEPADLASASTTERTCWKYEVERVRPGDGTFVHLIGLFVVIPR